MNVRNGTLDDLYFEWLVSKVSDVEETRPDRTYWNLLRQMYCTRFTWFVPNDDNREEDGKDLRAEFEIETGVEVTSDWLELDCSIFEMLLALANRTSFEARGLPETWFWRFLRNIFLIDLNDDRFTENSSAGYIDKTITKLNTRTYAYNGYGGIFPLEYPTVDQRTVELWYQMSSYIQENNY